MSFLRGVVLSRGFRILSLFTLAALVVTAVFNIYSNQTSYLKNAPEVAYEQAFFKQIDPELLVAENENKDKVNFWDNGAEFVSEDDPRISLASSSENFSSEVYYQRAANSNENFYTVRMIVWEKDSTSRTPLLYVFKVDIAETYHARWPYYIYDSGYRWIQAEEGNVFFKEYYLKGGLITALYPLTIAGFWSVVLLIVSAIIYSAIKNAAEAMLVSKKETLPV